LAASFVSNQSCDVAYWHETDMLTLLSDVRCWSNSGKHVLFQSISPFDPHATLAVLQKSIDVPSQAPQWWWGCNVYGKPSLGGDSGTGLEARQGLSDCSVTK